MFAIKIWECVLQEMNGHDFPQLSWLGCGFFNPQKMARSLGYD
jgi:hypothetical protein